jgi:hypothetical protein
MSLISCTLVFVSFALFAHDQVAGASQRQQNALVSTVTPAPATSGHHTVGQPRRFIDNAAKGLMSPFATLVHSKNAWVSHGLPAIVALLVYGLGLGTLARFAYGGAKL